MQTGVIRAKDKANNQKYSVSVNVIAQDSEAGSRQVHEHMCHNELVERVFLYNVTGK